MTTLALPCGGAWHELEFDPDGLGIEVGDHDPAEVDAELAMAALGGEAAPCVAVLAAWRATDLRKLAMPLRQLALPALLPRLEAAGHELHSGNRQALAVVGRNVLAAPLSQAMLQWGPLPPLGFDVSVGRAIRSPLRQTPGQAQATGFVTLTYSQVTIQLSLAWFTDIWNLGLSDLDGEPVLEARRRGCVAEVRVARFFDQPGVLDSWGDPLPVEKGKVWRLATVPRRAERAADGTWHPAD